MLSDQWVLFLLILFVLSAIVGSSELLLVTLLMSLVTCVAWLWNRWSLRGVEYTRELTVGRTFAGERVSVSVTVTNRKALPVPWLRVDDSFPGGLVLIGRDLKPSGSANQPFLRYLASLGPYERIRWRYDIDCPQRGFYFLGPVQIHSGDMLGFFARRQPLRLQTRLIVYPRVRPLPELGFPNKNPFGEKGTRRHIVEDPSRTVGVREYHPEDSIKRVHWKASARHGELQVKVYQPIVTQQLVVFLNVASFAQPWLGIMPERQEQAISVAASIAYHATEQRFAIGLIANGSVPHSDQSIKVLPGRAPDQLMRILEALAAVTGFATTSIEDLLGAESPRLALGATLVVVTTVVSERLLAQMVRLQDAGRRLALVSMDPEFQGEGPSGMTTYHIPLAEADFTGMWTRALGGEQRMSEAGVGRGYSRVSAS